MGHTKETGRRAVLTVSFGTADSTSLKYEIGAVEQAVARALPEFEPRRAFASQYIIDRLKQRDGIEIDNVTDALLAAAEDGITVLAVQPTYFTYGYEYEALEAALRDSRDRFEQIYLGQPLLHADADLMAVALAAVQRTAAYDDGNTAVCFMGHGTKKENIGCSGDRIDHEIYIKLQETLIRMGYKNHYVATMQAAPSFEELLERLEKNGAYQKTVLMPLMLSAGRHAVREMAGSGKDSWKSRLAGYGFEVDCIMEGFGRLQPVQQLYAAHAQAAAGRRILS